MICHIVIVTYWNPASRSDLFIKEGRLVIDILHGKYITLMHDVVLCVRPDTLGLAQHQHMEVEALITKLFD